MNTARMQTDVVGRFAPSPTGRMHAGNVFAALAAWLVAKAQGGKIVLRIEDLDTERSKPQFIDAVQRDFEQLGLTWDKGPYFQHNRKDAYLEAFESLSNRGLVYPCFCTRADLHAASAPHRSEKFVYPGTCRSLTPNERMRLMRDHASAQRLVTPGACQTLPVLDDPHQQALIQKLDHDSCVSFFDEVQGFYSQNLARDCGDFIVRRSDGAFAYQLAVVVDDAEQGINSVVRGVDLLSSTPQQIYLQNLLDLSHPTYAHIPLIVAEDKRRLSKRNADAALDVLLERFKTPEGVIGHIAGLTGLAPTCDPASPDDLLKTFNLQALPANLRDLAQIYWH